MLPANLTAAAFHSYPPEAQALAVEHLALLQQLPLAFLPNLLRELIDFDEKFPAERTELRAQLTYLATLTTPQLSHLFANFSSLGLSPDLQSVDWVNQPLTFTEGLSAHLWSTHQMDSFRAAATAYGTDLQAALPPAPLPIPRLGIAVIGLGAPAPKSPLFRKLREHGTYFSHIDPTDGLGHLLAAVYSRATSHPVPYGHWYVEGGASATHDLDPITTVSYSALTPVLHTLLDRIQTDVSRPGMGPEELRNHLARLAPTELGMHGDPVLDRFQLRLLTEGSGTQIFSTTFAQWTAREALRRAQPLTLLTRFAPRQRQRPMNELLTRSEAPPELDPVGSLIDADMAAYYQWINQGRLPGSKASMFLAWFEGANEAVAIGPSMPRAATSTSPLKLAALLALMTDRLFPRGSDLTITLPSAYPSSS